MCVQLCVLERNVLKTVTSQRSVGRFFLEVLISIPNNSLGFVHQTSKYCNYLYLYINNSILE